MAMEHKVDPLFRPLAKNIQANVIARPSLSNGQQVVRKLLKNKLAMLGLFIILALVAMAIIGPNLVPYSYSDQSLLTKNQEISAEHWRVQPTSRVAAVFAHAVHSYNLVVRKKCRGGRRHNPGIGWLVI
ncbi:hypothetical protein BP422_04010 [Brevibacillus formosus]|uniref:Oligopeptide transport permease C-like N-terminal domain-containing protein n=1 Tax=Brevibacillus formosus TaxID=54913 RepID=A0A220MCN6_9BACL|nr:hypothetical protein BP422_04010 [Brevibacillus formosus]